MTLACGYSVDELKSLLTDDDKLQSLLASRVAEVHDVQQKVVLFLEKFASKSSHFTVVNDVVVFIRCTAWQKCVQLIGMYGIMYSCFFTFSYIHITRMLLEKYCRGWGTVFSENVIFLCYCYYYIACLTYFWRLTVCCILDENIARKTLLDEKKTIVLKKVFHWSCTVYLPQSVNYKGHSKSLATRINVYSSSLGIRVSLVVVSVCCTSCNLYGAITSNCASYSVVTVSTSYWSLRCMVR